MKLSSDLEEGIRSAKSLEDSLFESLASRAREFGGNISSENYKNEISTIVREAREQNSKRIKAISDIEYRNHQIKKDLLDKLEYLATVFPGLEIATTLEVNSTVLRN